MAMALLATHRINISGCALNLGGLESRVLAKKRLQIRAAEKSRSVGPAPASSSNSHESSPAQSHLDLLQRITENSPAAGAQVKTTIRDQLLVEPEGADGGAVSLASAQKEKSSTLPELTISQRRNIRRQNYLNKVSERNDAPFFALVAAIFLVPPLLILAFAVATGYVELFP